MESLRAFRRNAVHVRAALAGLGDRGVRVTMDDGRLQHDRQLVRLKHLAIPVRRALNPTDRASFTLALADLRAVSPAPAGLAAATAAWTATQQDLDTTVTYGGQRLARRALLAALLDAAAFHSSEGGDRAYSAFIEEWGTAAEGLGAQMAEDVARVIIQLDALAAGVLGEPEILPPPEKMPPPPPDPKEPLWKRIWALIGPEPKDR